MTAKIPSHHPNHIVLLYDDTIYTLHHDVQPGIFVAIAIRTAGNRPPPLPSRISTPLSVSLFLVCPLSSASSDVLSDCFRTIISLNANLRDRLVRTQVKPAEHPKQANTTPRTRSRREPPPDSDSQTGGPILFDHCIFFERVFLFFERPFLSRFSIDLRNLEENRAQTGLTAAFPGTQNRIPKTRDSQAEGSLVSAHPFLTFVFPF